MAGGGGSTGGIGAQSPAVNPPNPMGQIGNAIGSAFGGAQQPMGGVPSSVNSFPTPSGFGMGQQPIRQDLSSMGGNVDMGMGYNPGMQQPGYNPNLAAMFGGPNGQQSPNTFGNLMGGMATPPSQTYEGYLAGRSPMQQDVQLTRDQWQQGQNQMGAMQPGLGQPQLTPDMMAAMQRAQTLAMQQGQGGMGQQPAGLMALLGGQPRPAPAMAPNPGKPAPVASQPRPAPPTPTARPAPTATKPVAKPTVVPPKTPPAVANAIQKLAMKNPMGRR